VTRFSACIVAAGHGERAGGGEPKQFRKLHDRPVLAWSLGCFAAHSDCSQIIVAHAPGGGDAVCSAAGTLSERLTLVEGGATRSRSVQNALAAAQEARVLIHDAARPLLTGTLIDRLLAALDSADGAVPAVPVTDALARIGPDGLTPVDRSPLVRLQTPQAFHTGALRRAFSQSPPEAAWPDEVSLAHAQGLEIISVEGDEANFKLTWPDDFSRAEALLRQRHGRSSAMTVTGGGYDVHRLAPGDGLHLCGVFIACPLRLIGHSDADAGLHALTDAVLGAAGLGDIGEHFPPSDDQWKGADSSRFLAHALELAQAAGAEPVHADITLICEHPKIGPHKQAMRERVAALLGLASGRVNIKATTTEGLGFTGRGEGLAAQAVITMRISS